MLKLRSIQVSKPLYRDSYMMEWPNHRLHLNKMLALQFYSSCQQARMPDSTHHTNWIQTWACTSLRSLTWDHANYSLVIFSIFHIKNQNNTFLADLNRILICYLKAKYLWPNYRFHKHLCRRNRWLSLHRRKLHINLLHLV